MTVRRLSLVVSIVGVLAFPAVAQSFTIRVSGGSARDSGVVTQIGPWSMRNPTLRRAMQVFGRPSSTQALRPGFPGLGSADCIATWGGIGLRVVFTTLGFAPGVCDPNKQVWKAQVTTNRWTTWSGLRIGDLRSRLFRVHPNRFFRGGVGWVIATKFFPFGPAPGRIPSVSATVMWSRPCRTCARIARINQFRLFVDAQGE